MEQPRVSIIMIFLDASTYLAEAIESVLRQTYGSWELLLIDDGSTDDSSRTAVQYAADDPARIHYMDHPGHANLGMSASRNAGLREARGQFVAFLDADDVWLPEKLERQVQALDDHAGAAMVYSATLLWYQWAGEAAEARRDRPRLLGVTPGTLVSPPLLVPLYLRGTADPPATCGVLVRRTAALDVGGFEADFRGMFEDQVFFYKIALAHAVYILDGHWDLYRQHPASHCSIAERDGLYHDDLPSATHHAFLGWLERYLLRDGRGGTVEVHRELRRRLRAYRRPRLYRVERALSRLMARIRRGRSTGQTGGR